MAYGVKSARSAGQDAELRLTGHPLGLAAHGPVLQDLVEQLQEHLAEQQAAAPHVECGAHGGEPRAPPGESPARKTMQGVVLCAPPAHKSEAAYL